MDRMIYLAMSGARQTLEQQAAVSHNLANAATNGFRAELNVFRSVPVKGDGLATRTFVASATSGTDFSPGPVQKTGRELDVAVEGQGWIAVQAADGSEAYTRNGALQVGTDGTLRTRSGLAVVGDGGPISVAGAGAVNIGADGTVSMTGGQGALVVLGRIKLVNPDPASLARGGDGLFRVAGGDPAEADATVRLSTGALEGSNVSVVEAMVDMIALARQFDTQMKLLETAEANERHANQTLSNR